MEPGAALWSPYDFQLVNWATEEPAAVAVEYGASCLQTSAVPNSIVEGHHQQLIDQYYYASAAAQTDPADGEAALHFVVDFHDMETKNSKKKIHSPPEHVADSVAVFQEEADEFEDDIKMMKMKIHRYPPSFRLLDERYTAPRMVAIGPRHHGRHHLTPAEKAKHVAAHHCIRESSGGSVQEMYDAVAAVAGDARRLYDEDAVAGVGDDDFLPMMFYDACFLVQYMLSCTTGAGRDEMDPALRSYLDANDDDIFHDLMLLENQIPWRVVEAVMRFRPVPLGEFIASLEGFLQDRKDLAGEEDPSELDDGYEPPHLLGLVRFYTVGRGSADLPSLHETKSISVSVSAIELAEIGIALTPNRKKDKLIDMGVRNKGTFFPELSMAPLSLDTARASWLVNMAALELCATPYFHEAGDEESAVCSYLLLLGMLVCREEDVQELRVRGLLQGGGGLTNQEALQFFTSLQGLRLGSRYVRTMEEIESYKVKRRVKTKVHAFVYKNKKTIVAVGSAIGALRSIIGTIKSLKGAP